MKLTFIDLLILAGYMLAIVLIGLWTQRRATRNPDSYYLGDRNIPWWMLGLSGCSSYIDIGGTMAMVGLMYATGLKAVWLTHIFWGWFIICFYMAFQAKWIRRSGVMTFAEWNRTRFGEGRDTEIARASTAVFLLVLMVLNLMFIAVGIGKFAEEFLPLERWQSILLVFGCVGVYTTLGGFFGVIFTDMLQTALIAVGAVLLAWLCFAAGDPTPLVAGKHAAWSSLMPSWSLWPGYAQEVGGGYEKYNALGPLLLGSFAWVIFRVLAGPNVWDFQFFLSARSPRHAALAGGLWTAGYTLRWILGTAFLVLGLRWLGGQGSEFDGEKIMPLVLLELPAGIRGMFVALLLAALMSTLDAMVNVTSSVAINDVAKRSFARAWSPKNLVRLGQFASLLALGLGFFLSLSFQSVASAWETMIFVFVTMILVPATFRWHWWRFSALAFVFGMIGTAVCVLCVHFLPSSPWPDQISLPVTIGASLLLCLTLGFVLPPAPREVLVEFYANVRPFGFWRPIRHLAIERGLVAARDREPLFDLLNGLLTAIFQVALCLVPFYALLWRRSDATIAGSVVVGIGAVLWFTWYRRLPED
jgi:Na+/proline symporter